MIHKLLFALLGLTLIPTTLGWAQTAQRESAIKDNDRIVFIGDSITGQGAKGGKGGWIAMIGEGLNLTRPQAKPILIGLGGSGSTVGAWLNHEKRSRTEPIALDVKETDVGKTLDAGAEIVVVMLGMNDVLSPSLKNDPADFDAWITRYGDLVEAIRARSHPRVIALATVTPCTEDPASPKNQVLAELNKRLVKLAREKQFLVLPTNEASYEVQSIGRDYQPHFRVTGDFVHPNSAGHLAIAVGMLRGLGEESAAAKLLAEHSALYKSAADKFPTLSYTLVKAPGSPDDETQRFTVQYQWTSTTSQAAPLVKPAVPKGWKANPESLNAAKGQFEFSGSLDHVENTVTLTATSGGESREQLITIPAGWRIAVGRGKGLGWVQNTTYDPSKDRQPLDESLAKGDGLSAPVAFPVGGPAPWTLHVASNDYTGLNRPGSVDMAAVVFFSYNQQAYGARWIHSDKDRPVNINLGTQCFAGTYSLGVWLNGKPAYEGKLMGEPGHKVTSAAALRRGWNLLVFKSTFIQWQWQFSIEVTGQEGDDLSDLRYSTKPLN
jgi:lysophospholipase L1-like esterase